METEAPQRMPWERQSREPTRAYSCFTIYRDLGTERSLTAAVRVYLTVKPDKRATTRLRQQRRFQTHPSPGRYLRDVRNLWGRWSSKWGWVERCRAYDEYTSAEAEDRALDAQIQRKVDEQRDLEEERKRQIEAGRKSVQAGSAVVRRIVELFEAGGLNELALQRIKMMVVGKDGAKAERETKSIVELLPAALAALVEGQRLQRLAQEKPTEIVKSDVSDDSLQAILRGFAEIIRDVVPPQQWDTAALKVDELIKGVSGNGKPH